MTEEPTAIRRVSGDRFWHRFRYVTTVCGLSLLDYFTDTTPLSRTAPADRCRACWSDTLTPTTEETERG